MEILQNIGIGFCIGFFFFCFLTTLAIVLKMILARLVWLKFKYWNKGCETNCAPMIKPAVVEKALEDQKGYIWTDNPESKIPESSKVRQPDGLERAFRRGEFIPWKRIQFMVESVTPDRITLVPMDVTNAFKKRKAREHAH